MWANVSGGPNEFQASACWAVSFSVTFSPEPPTRIGRPPIGAGFELAEAGLQPRQVVAQLVQPVDRRAELVAVLAVVALEPTGADAEVHAATRHVIGGACHVGEQFGVAVAVAGDEHPELGPLGVGGHGGEDRPAFEVRLVGVAVQREEVIPGPDRVDAELLRPSPGITDLDVRRRLRVELNADVEGHGIQ